MIGEVLAAPPPADWLTATLGRRPAACGKLAGGAPKCTYYERTLAPGVWLPPGCLLDSMACWLVSSAGGQQVASQVANWLAAVRLIGYCVCAQQAGAKAPGRALKVCFEAAP